MADPGIFDLGGTSNSIADAIRRQAASQAKQPEYLDAYKVHSVAVPAANTDLVADSA